jgi:trans-aconitate methyltransferase
MSLYTDLSHVYRHMYQRLFDYDAEFDQLSTLFARFDVKSVIEFGCGTGNLATRILQTDMDYFGTDISHDMVNEAKLETGKNVFAVADVRSYVPSKRFDAAYMVGRTISYLISDEDVCAAFLTMKKSICSNGVIIFDAIDASLMLTVSDLTDTVVVTLPYKRYSRSNLISATPYLWHWSSEYVELIAGGERHIGKDESTLRAFYEEEITDMLDKCGLKIVDRIAKQSYAWDDHYYVAQAM